MLPFYPHWQQHSILRPNTCKGMERDDEGVSMRLLRRAQLVLLDSIVLSPGGRAVVVDVVHGFQIEEALVDVARDKGLVTIVAEPLSAALQLLGWCEATKWALPQCSVVRWRCLGCARQRWMALAWSRANRPWWRELLDGRRATLKRSGIVYGRLEILGAS